MHVRVKHFVKQVVGDVEPRADLAFGLETFLLL